VIAQRRRHGLLHPIFRSVYLWGGPVPADGTFETAAILTCRRRVVLGLESALALWEVTLQPSEVNVVRLSGRNRSRDGLIIHSTATLRPDELATRYGLPTTTPLRALLDLAAHGHPRIERIVSAAHAKGAVTASGLSAYAAGRAGLPGAPLLRELAGIEAPGHTRSENERRLRTLCREAGLPQPHTNAKLFGWEVDFLWADAGLVVEVDAVNTHSDVAVFERDRHKQRALVAAGLVVLRFTDRMLHGEPLPVAVDLAQAIARGQRQRA
jgi:very-short-patch-repair endonuclease